MTLTPTSLPSNTVGPFIELVKNGAPISVLVGYLVEAMKHSHNPAEREIGQIIDGELQAFFNRKLNH